MGDGGTNTAARGDSGRPCHCASAEYLLVSCSCAADAARLPGWRPFPNRCIANG